MKLRTIAEIATIGAVVIAFLQYSNIKPNALDKIPEMYRAEAESDVENVKLKINEQDYKAENKSLFFQYKAAIAIPEKYSKDNAIKKVVSEALRANDLKLAVAATKEMEEKYSKSNTLEKIVGAALSNGDRAGYAVVAAELIPEKYSKSNALEKIVKYYQAKSSINGTTQPPSELEKYKEIFGFADAPAHMSLSSEEAKEFTASWLKTRTYSQFRFFKMVFEFADAPAYLNMSSEDAAAFSFKFIDYYNEEEFLIYKESFQFADKPAGMGLSTEDAMIFAKNKVAEHRAQKKAANKTVQPTAKSGG